MAITIDTPEYTYYDFTIKTGATSPALQAELTDSNDDPVELDEATVRFKMAKPGGNVVINETASITDYDDAEVTYFWRESDTDEAGVYNAEFAVDYNSGTGDNFDATEFFPSDEFLDIHIKESL